MPDIKIRNLKDCKPLNPYDFIVDRNTPLGNPYHIVEGEFTREQAVNAYKLWFAKKLRDFDTNTPFHKYLRRIRRAYGKYGKVNLYCWCFPKDCHAKSIKFYLETTNLFESRGVLCQVPGCKHKYSLGWSPGLHMEHGAKICKHHMSRHADKDDKFSLWNYVPIRQEKAIAEMNRYTSTWDKNDKESLIPRRIRGREGRRSAEIKLRDPECSHSYDGVVWDLLYRTSRCTKCGIQLKRVKKGGRPTKEYKPRRFKHKFKAGKHLSDLSLTEAMMFFFFEKGTVNTSWGDAVEIARAVKPNTKYNNAAFCWYRNQFIKNYVNRKDNKMAKRKKDKEKTKTKGKTKDKAKKKTKEKRVSIKSVIYDYFDKVGVDKAKFDKAQALAENVKADTAFNEQHFSWYKGQYLKEH